VTRTATFRGAAVLGAMLLAALMIMTASRAAFTDLASNDGNSWTAGTVSLHDARVGNSASGDETGAALFAPATDIAPGYTETACIDVVYDGSLDATSLLTSVTVVSGNTLAAVLDVDVDRYDGASCGGAAEAANIVTGTLDSPTISETAWAGTGGSSTTKSYSITVSMAGSVADNTLQGQSAAANFEWTATSS